MAPVRKRVRVAQQPRGRFLVTIGGAEVVVDTNAAVVQETMGEIRRETIRASETFPAGRDIRSIAGLKVASRTLTDPRPAIFQLCIGNRCVLLPVLNDQPLPPALTDHLATCRFLKIVGIDVPGPGAACFGGTAVPWDDPWMIGLRKGRTEFLQLRTLDPLALYVTRESIVRPRVEEEYTMEALARRWPPTPPWAADLCVDVYQLRQVGRKLLL